MANKIFNYFLIGIFGIFLSGPVQAEGSIFRGLFAEPPLEEIELYVGDVETVKVNNLERVSVRNPDIADVVRAELNTIVLSAKKEGVTHLFFWDKSGRNEVRVRVFPEDISNIYAQVEDILDSLGLNRVYSRPLREQGRILLLGTVRNSEEKRRLSEALGVLRAKVTDLTTVEEDKLVEISVKVLELRKDATERLGFDVPSSISVSEIAPVPSSKWADFFKIGQLQRTELGWTLDLLVREGKARILSRPKLVCQSGKEAELLVGGEKPIFETTVAREGAEGTSVSYKDYGIKLNINPVVVSDDRVEIALRVEVTDVGEVEAFGVDKAQAFPLTTRSINTNLYLNDGETLVMGGLIQEKTDEDLKRFPWLADIPILGAFFRQKERRVGGGFGERGDQELFVTLTPRIIQSQGRPSLDRVEARQEFKPDSFRFDRDLRVSSELQDYALAVQRQIISNAFYPSSLAGTGWRGELLLELKLARNGMVKNVEIVRSSGYRIFDEQALRLVEDLTFPSFPSEVRQKEVKITIPVVYTER